jgi:hypothetical protein
MQHQKPNAPHLPKQLAFFRTAQPALNLLPQAPLAYCLSVMTDDATGFEVNQVYSLAGDTGHRFIDVTSLRILAI